MSIEGNFQKYFPSYYSLCVVTIWKMASELFTGYYSNSINDSLTVH